MNKIIALSVVVFATSAFAQIPSAQEAKHLSIKNAETIVNTRIAEAIQRGETRTDSIYVYWDEDTLKAITEKFSMQGYEVEKTLEQVSGFSPHYIVKVHWSKVKPKS